MCISVLTCVRMYVCGPVGECRRMRATMHTQRLGHGLCGWFLLSTCLRQGILFAAVYIRLAGLTVLGDSPAFPFHLPVISDFYLIITSAPISL